MTTAERARRDALVASCARLVHSIARRHVRPGIELDDLVQAGWLGAMRAAERFDSRIGGASLFWLYAYRGIRWSIIEEVSAHLRKSTSLVSMDGDGNSPDLHQILSDDLAVDAEAQVIERDEAARLRAQLRDLPELERQSLALRYGIDL